MAGVPAMVGPVLVAAAAVASGLAAAAAPCHLTFDTRHHTRPSFHHSPRSNTTNKGYGQAEEEKKGGLKGNGRQGQVARVLFFWRCLFFSLSLFAPRDKRHTNLYVL